jgi:hypothetical protein
MAVSFDEGVGNVSNAPGETDDQGYDEEDEEDPEQKLGGLHGEASHPTEADRRRDQSHDKEYDCVVQEVAHDQFLDLVCKAAGRSRLRKRERQLKNAEARRRFRVLSV